MPNKEMETGAKFFVAFISVCLTLFGVLLISMFVVIEMAMWRAGAQNWLVWHTIFLVIGYISSYIYKWIGKKGEWL